LVDSLSAGLVWDLWNRIVIPMKKYSSKIKKIKKKKKLNNYFLKNGMSFKKTLIIFFKHKFKKKKKKNQKITTFYGCACWWTKTSGHLPGHPNSVPFDTLCGKIKMTILMQLALIAEFKRNHHRSMGAEGCLAARKSCVL
jgi:hypothetical protein